MYENLLGYYEMIWIYNSEIERKKYIGLKGRKNYFRKKNLRSYNMYN